MTPAGSPRLPYRDLPALLRTDIEAALGSPVATVTACTRAPPRDGGRADLLRRDAGQRLRRSARR